MLAGAANEEHAEAGLRMVSSALPRCVKTSVISTGFNVIPSRTSNDSHMIQAARLPRRLCLLFMF